MDELYCNIFDSHSHYDDDRFDGDRDTLLTALFETSVAGIVHAATDLRSSEFGIAYAGRFAGFYTSVGIHPESAADVPAGAIELLAQRIAADRAHPTGEKRRIVAVGEIGLDYHYDGFDRAAQLALFEQQLVLAREYNLPVIVHMRDATEDCMALLTKYKPRGVMHCFSGSAETARAVLALGMLISFTGVLTFKNAKKALKALAEVSTDKILVETDCPYMAPEPYRGTRCTSAMIARSAEVIAREKGLSPQEILNLTAENACALFGLSN
ncbi:MAG: TatD family hydrolase [Oscillospiraceae bacterium]